MNESLELEDRVQRMEDAIWGPFRNNGVVGEVKSLRADVQGWRVEEQKRRESANRALLLALLAALVSLIGTVATLVTVVAA